MDFPGRKGINALNSRNLSPVLLSIIVTFLAYKSHERFFNDLEIVISTSSGAHGPRTIKILRVIFCKNHPDSPYL